MTRALPAVLFLSAVSGLVPAVAADKDARIEAAARHSYNFRVHLQGDTIQVKSVNGEVSLTGTVADGFHKSLAEATVADLPGVKSVINHLMVKGEAPAESSDAWLTSKVKSALLYSRNVNGTGTRVETKGGVVTLSGEASSLAQKELTEEVAKGVEGVRAVTNDLKVVSMPPASKTVAEKIDDASVTAQVKASLLFHRGTRMLATKVSTNRGVVTVRGAAKNLAERDLVTRLVTGINGVKRVDNRMAIEP